jgi:hypothetical protein
VAFIIVDVPLSWVEEAVGTWCFAWLFFADTGLSDTTTLVFVFDNLVCGEVTGWSLNWSTWSTNASVLLATLGFVFKSHKPVAWWSSLVKNVTAFVNSIDFFVIWEEGTELLFTLFDRWTLFRLACEYLTAFFNTAKDLFFIFSTNLDLASLSLISGSDSAIIFTVVSHTHVHLTIFMIIPSGTVSIFDAVDFAFISWAFTDVVLTSTLVSDEFSCAAIFTLFV